MLNFKLKIKNYKLRINNSLRSGLFKKIGLLFLLLFSLQITFAQSFLMQGVLKDQYGKSLNGFNAVTFTLYETHNGNDAIWTEVHPSVLSESGLFTVELGSITSFGELMFDQSYWLGVQVEDNTEMPRMKLSVVPHSYAVKGVHNTFSSAGNVGIGTTNANENIAVSKDEEAIISIQSGSNNALIIFAENGAETWKISKTNANSALNIQNADGTDVLTFNTNGSVGISSSDQSALINIGNNGDVTIEGNLSSNHNTGGVAFNDAHFIGGDGNDNVGFKAGESGSLMVTTDGNVGVGTANPVHKLEVVGDVKINNGGIEFADGTSIESLASDFAATAVSNPENLLVTADTDENQTGGHEFRIGGETQMVITNDGKLGLGNNNPTSALDVVGDINFTGNLSKNGETVNTSAWEVDENGNISTTNNVGIGSANPSFNLNVDGAIRVETDFFLSDGTTLEPPPHFTAPNVDHPNWYVHHGKIEIDTQLDGGSGYSWLHPDNLVYTNQFVGASRQSNDRNAFVYSSNYLGTWTNSSRMKVQSDYIGSPDHVWQDTYVQWWWYSNMFDLSDRRIKQNIRPVNNALNKVMALSGVKYDINTETHPGYKDIDKNGEFAKLNNHLGFIAQELKEVLPELVFHDDESGYYGIRNYHQMMPILTEAIKALDQENTELENRLEALKNGINQLKEVK